MFISSPAASSTGPRVKLPFGLRRAANVNIRPPRLLILLLSAAFFAGALTANADWRDDTGFTRLQQTFTSGVPTAVVAGVSQIEALESGANYAPSAPNKSPTLKSGASGVSGHASTVASYYYGEASSLIPATTIIDAYKADTWLNADFLNYGSASAPKTETRRVQNHSWISATGLTESQVVQLDQRLDYAINRDGFIAVAGANNGASTTLPQLMVQAYHTLSVGLTNGGHSAGLTTNDGLGRMKPDLVAYETLTSFATPQVSSAAGLLSEKLRNDYAASLATADYPRLTKALLLAGATKDDLPAWTRADATKPYDAVFGAGALNALLAYRILASGRASPSASATVPETAWDINTTRSATARTYFLDIPSGTTAARFSAALTWHRSLTFFSGSFSTSLANLDLRLYGVAPGTFTVGSQLDASLSTVDNVEHLYQPALAPGRYAIKVTSSLIAFTTYALAWRSSPTVSVTATAPTASEATGAPGIFTVTRTGSTLTPLLVPLAWSGTVIPGTHCQALPATLLLPAGVASATITVTPIADDLAQGERSLLLTLTQDFSLSVGAASTSTVTLQDKPYDAWRFTRFTGAQLADSAVSGPSADPDADGIPNLLEYAFALEPFTPDPGGALPTHAVDAGGYLTFTYFHPSARTELTYTVEWSADLLAAWQSGQNYVTETARVPVSGGEQVTVSTLATAATQPLQFLRLRVTSP